MKNNKNIKIFIGTREIAGYYIRLQQEFTKIGIKADYYCYYNPAEYVKEKDFSNYLSKTIYLLTKKRYYIIKNQQKSFIDKIKLIYIYLLLEILSFVLLIYSIFKYEVFIFSFASSIIPYPYLLDLPILKIFRKKIISCVFHGSELRPRYVSMYGINRENPQIKDLKEIYKTTKIQKKKAKIIEKYSDIVIGSYLTSHFLTKKFINYLHIGYISPNPQSIEISNETKEKIIILHAPSKPSLKGTEKIREAIKKLQHKYNIEYIELTGKTNEEVIEAIKKCDFVVDQIYSDTPLAGLGTEAAIFGKPTITGGYVWEEFRKLPPDIVAPSYLCHPDDIKNAIETMITNKKLRIEIGQKAQAFVLNNWTPDKIAMKFLKIINNEIPPEWYCFPIENYSHFCFVEKNLAINILKKYIDYFGEKALFLENKPNLKKQFLNLINYV